MHSLTRTEAHVLRFLPRTKFPIQYRTLDDSLVKAIYLSCLSIPELVAGNAEPRPVPRANALALQKSSLERGLCDSRTLYLKTQHDLIDRYQIELSMRLRASQHPFAKAEATSSLFPPLSFRRRRT